MVESNVKRGNPLIGYLNDSKASNNASAINPYAMMEAYAKSNPEIAQAFALLQNGRNPQELFYSLCRIKGVNPQAILGSLKV